MRLANPTAPVDTMGCADLYWPTSSPAEQRYHTLTALMLSSQTKDTVTAPAMHRLHTLLAPRAPNATHSVLTIANILAASPTHLDALLRPVGFHHTKTRHLRATALLLAQHHGSDIPATLAGLLALPGVGPKMAHLALSAAWGETHGIGVDVHVHRITNRWGWHGAVPTRGPEETRRALEAWLPRERWYEINPLLVGLGQTVCLPVGRRCGECVLAGRGLCRAEVRGGVEGKGRGKGKGNGKKRSKGGNEEETKVERDEEEVVVKQEEEETGHLKLPAIDQVEEMVANKEEQEIEEVEQPRLKVEKDISG